MLELIKPYARAARLKYRIFNARWRAHRADRRDPAETLPVAFVIGCGRSGTSILGRTLAMHPQIRFFYEPYHLWAAIEPRTDSTNLFGGLDGRCFLDRADVTEQHRRRFRALLAARGRDGRSVVVEKTPINTLRIGFLEELAPQARYVHIVRSGLDVCRSIERIAMANEQRTAGLPTFNQWWGAADAKWRALIRDGAAAGYFPDSVTTLRSHLQRGAYEWLVSMAEVDRWRPGLADRLLEFRFDALVADPADVLGRISAFLGLQAPGDWLQRAAARIESQPSSRPVSLRLPAAMRRAFNGYQDRYGFPDRAEPESGEAQPTVQAESRRRS